MKLTTVQAASDAVHETGPAEPPYGAKSIDITGPWRERRRREAALHMRLFGGAVHNEADPGVLSSGPAWFAVPEYLADPIATLRLVEVLLEKGWEFDVTGSSRGYGVVVVGPHGRQDRVLNSRKFHEAIFEALWRTLGLGAGAGEAAGSTS